MILSSQQLAEIVSHLREVSEAQNNAEKRGAARMIVQHPVRVTSIGSTDATHAFTVLTRDISHSGLGVFTARPMPKGESYLVALPRTMDESTLVLSESVYSATKADALLTVGLRFLRLIDAATAQQLIKAAEQDQIQRISRSVLG